MPTSSFDKEFVVDRKQFIELLKRSGMSDERVNEFFKGGIVVESKNMFQEVAKVSDALQNVSDTLQNVSSTLDYILEPIMCMPEERLERKIKELKQSDGEDWAIGEMMERIKWLII